jgi:hypothetical protein
MRDGKDDDMHEVESEAPTPSSVAKKLAQQNLWKDSTENTDAFRDRVADEIVQRELARKEAREARKAEEALNKERARADGVKGTGPEGAPAGVDPAAAVAVAVRFSNEASSKPQDEEEHVGDADGKAKRKRGKRKCGRGGQGAKSGPHRQQAAPVAVQGRPFGAPRANGDPQFPKTNNRPNLFLPREQRKADVDRRHAAPNGTRPTRWDKPPAQAPRRKPPERTLHNSRRRQRTPSPVDRHPHHDDSKLLGFVAGALELIKKRVLRHLTRYTDIVVLTHLFVSLHRWSEACECHSPSVLSWVGNSSLREGRVLIC